MNTEDDSLSEASVQTMIVDLATRKSFAARDGKGFQNGNICPRTMQHSRTFIPLLQMHRTAWLQCILKILRQRLQLSCEARFHIRGHKDPQEKHLIY